MNPEELIMECWKAQKKYSEELKENNSPAIASAFRAGFMDGARIALEAKL